MPKRPRSEEEKRRSRESSRKHYEKVRTWNPWHVACAAGTKFERVCPQCGRESVAPWRRGRFTTLQHSGEFFDLVAEEEAAEERQREREREESRKRELEGTKKYKRKLY
jgi:hypothetical protein